MLRGKVKTLIIGLINILNNVRQAPTTKATQIGSTTIPEIILVVTKTEAEIKTQFKIIFILIKIKQIIDLRPQSKDYLLRGMLL